MRFRPNGFTLIELLVAVTLMAIAAAIVVPKLGQSQDWVRVPSAGRQVLADMLYLQNYAIMQQKTVWVYFITDDNGNAAYTAAIFASGVTATAPSYSQAIAATTTFTGTFVPRPSSTAVVGQPAVTARLITQFGGKAVSSRAMGALSQTRLNSVTVNNNAVTSFAFDWSGQPVNASGALAYDVVLTITSPTGTSPTSVHIRPVSGEMTTTSP